MFGAASIFSASGTNTRAAKLLFAIALFERADFIDIESKLRTDDPYSIETYDNFVPVTESRSDDSGEETETTTVTAVIPSEEEMLWMRLSLNL